MRTDKLFNPAEHRTPPGSGHSSGQFAPGRVTPSSTGGGSGGGGGGGGSGGGGGRASNNTGESPRESAEPSGGDSAVDAHAAAMATMDEQQADQIRAQIASLRADLKNLNAEIKFWSQPFKPTATAGSSTSSGGTPSSQAARNTPAATAGSSTSSGGTGSGPASGQTAAQFVQQLKGQAAGIREHISDLEAQVRALERRADLWRLQAKSEERPEVIKDDPGEITLLVSQLILLLECLD